MLIISFIFLLNHLHYRFGPWSIVCSKRTRTLIFRFSSYQIPPEQLFQVTLLAGCRVLNILLPERSLGKILFWLPFVLFSASCVQDVCSELGIELVRLVNLKLLHS